MKTLKDRIWERRRGVALILGFMVVYMICFTWLENRTGVPIHLLEIRADDYIPFCEYFIIPYFMWFGYIAVTVVYFTLFQDNKQDWWRLVLTLGFGMTLFIVVSFVFPNGHTLREYSFPRENIFTKMVRMLYKADTSTNIMPSIHVFNSVACCAGHFKIRQPEEPADAEDGCRCPDGTDYCIDDGFETADDPGCDCSIILELDLQRCDVWIHQNASIQLLVLGKIRFLRTPSFWRVSFIS